MKKLKASHVFFGITVLLMLLVFATAARAMDSCYTGSWNTEEIEHEGISLEVQPDGRVLGYFYTYRFFDRTGQNWLVFIGPPDNLVAYDVLSWGGETKLYEVGRGTVVGLDFDTLEFSFDFTLDLDQVDSDGVEIPDIQTPWCLDGRCEATYTYTRLTQPIPCD